MEASDYWMVGVAKQQHEPRSLQGWMIILVLAPDFLLLRGPRHPVSHLASATFHLSELLVHA